MMLKMTGLVKGGKRRKTGVATGLRHPAPRAVSVFSCQICTAPAAAPPQGLTLNPVENCLGSPGCAKKTMKGDTTGIRNGHPILEI